MPGLVEFHSHLQPDFGEAQGRAWLAFGVTSVRSAGGIPSAAVEERERGDAGASRCRARRVYPAAVVGMDGSEHTSGTSCRSYSPKLATLRSYEDVARIFGAARAGHSNPGPGRPDGQRPPP